MDGRERRKRTSQRHRQGESRRLVWIQEQVEKQREGGLIARDRGKVAEERLPVKTVRETLGKGRASRECGLSTRKEPIKSKAVVRLRKESAHWCISVSIVISDWGWFFSDSGFPQHRHPRNLLTRDTGGLNLGPPAGQQHTLLLLLGPFGFCQETTVLLLGFFWILLKMDILVI